MTAFSFEVGHLFTVVHLFNVYTQQGSFSFTILEILLLALILMGNIIIVFCLKLFVQPEHVQNVK